MNSSLGVPMTFDGKKWQKGRQGRLLQSHLQLRALLENMGPQFPLAVLVLLLAVNLFFHHLLVIPL